MSDKNRLPSTMKALVLTSTSEPPSVSSVPTPQPTHGSAVVRVLAAGIISYMRDVYDGSRNYTFPTPLIPGTSFVGRVAAVGPDATKLQPGDLVFVDTFIRSRDEPSHLCLAGLHDGYSEGSKKLMRDVFRDWSYAEYCRAPLENLHVLNENRLLNAVDQGGLGYKLEEACYISALAVPYGGLRDIELRAGQTIIIAPATGPFGGAAVVMALAMGARVIAMGRNKSALEKIKAQNPGRVETVPITGDMQADCAALKQHGPIDAFFDIGPPEAHASTHLKSAILALRPGARVSLMGGYREDVPIPHVFVMHSNIRLYGKWMYERSDVDDMIKMVEHGILGLGEKVGSEVVRSFPLEEWEEAWDCAAENAGVGQLTILKP